MIDYLNTLRYIAHRRLMERSSICGKCQLVSDYQTKFCNDHTGLYITWRQIVAALEGQ